MINCVLFYIQPDTGISPWPLIGASNGFIFFLNWLPIFLIILLFFFLSNNLVFAIFIPGFFFILLSVINRYMVAFRWSPLRPNDLLLGMEFLGVAKSIRLAVYITIGIGIVIFFGLFIVACMYVKNNKLNIKIRLTGIVACFILVFMFNKIFYSNSSINENLPVAGNPYNETDIYQSRGFVYSFLYDLNTNRIAKPDDYDHFHNIIVALEQEANDENRKNTALPVNVIMILSEAFSEISFSPFIDFNGYVNFFMLQDFIDENGQVKFSLPFDNFNRPPLPQTVDEYKQYKIHTIDLINSRNKRIFERM